VLLPARLRPLDQTPGHARCPQLLRGPAAASDHHILLRSWRTSGASSEQSFRSHSHQHEPSLCAQKLCHQLTHGAGSEDSREICFKTPRLLQTETPVALAPMISQLPPGLEGNTATPDEARSVSTNFWFRSCNPSPSGRVSHAFHLPSHRLCPHAGQSGLADSSASPDKRGAGAAPAAALPGIGKRLRAGRDPLHPAGTRPAAWRCSWVARPPPDGSHGGQGLLPRTACPRSRREAKGRGAADPGGLRATERPRPDRARGSARLRGAGLSRWRLAMPGPCARRC